MKNRLYDIWTLPVSHALSYAIDSGLKLLKLNAHSITKETQLIIYEFYSFQGFLLFHFSAHSLPLAYFFHLLLYVYGIKLQINIFMNFLKYLWYSDKLINLYFDFTTLFCLVLKGLVRIQMFKNIGPSVYNTWKILFLLQVIHLHENFIPEVIFHQYSSYDA